jgi:hypothetical protein
VDLIRKNKLVAREEQAQFLPKVLTGLQIKKKRKSVIDIEKYKVFTAIRLTHKLR